MSGSINSFWRTVNRSIFVGERLEKNLNDMAVLSAIRLVLGVTMFAVNLLQKDWITGLSPLFISVTSALSLYFAKIKKWRRGCIVLTSISLLFVFTWDVLFVSNGFAFLWTLLIPMPVCYIFGIRVGMALTGYFQLLYFTVFYTPLRRMVADNYSPIVLNRFPLLYLFNAVITLYVMYEYHRNVLADIERAESMRQEIREQTQYANERAGKIERLSYETVVALAKTIDAKDRYTNGHSFRVAEYAVALAKKLGWGEPERDELSREALLHDIGKIGVPDAVLNKPGRLTAEEYDAVKQHTIIGEGILSGLEDMTGFADVAMYHHERYDGRGYPTGLSGEEIPSHARVIALADAYDAMSSDRIYRSARTKDEILHEIQKERGRQFDPQYADAFLSLLWEGALDA